MSDSATAALMGDNGGGASGAAASAAPAASGAPSGAQPSWYGEVDEQTAAYIGNKGWQSPTDLLNSYRNLEKFAGGSKNLLELPGADADQAAWDNVYNRLGRPADPKEYGIVAPENGDPELVDWFTKTAHANGLTAKQAQTLFNQWNEMAGGKMEAMEVAARENSERAISELKREWGQAYDQQIDMGRRAVAALGLDQQKLTEYENKLGTGEMLKLFATLGSKMGEPSFADGGRSGNAGGFGLTPAQAQQQVADLKMDKQFMEQYMKGAPDAVNKMKRLMEAAYVSG